MARILIMGESARVREALAEELAEEGHLVVAIGNPALIRELLTTLEPDLVLLDFYIHGMSQGDPSVEIKRQAPHLPVFTSYGGYKGEIRLEMTGGYGMKSFSLETLKQKVAELLSPKPIRGFERARKISPPPESSSVDANELTTLRKKFRPFHPKEFLEKREGAKGVR